MTGLAATPFDPTRRQLGAGRALALGAEGRAPDWIELLPPGPVLQGRDGRSWRLDDPERIVASFQPPFVVDYEHAQDRVAPLGQEAPAAGWIEALETRDGAVWGRIDWTTRAAAHVASREYRFISPAFTFSPADDSVRELVGASLVNRPNFTMTALNSLGASMTKDIAAALGIAETAGPAEIVAVIGALRATALNAQQPDLSRFVPRADYELALNRAKEAEGKLAAGAKATHEVKVDAAIAGAVKAGKIAPASRDFYLATCSTAEGLAAFEKFIADAPSAFREIVRAGEGGGAGTTALNAEQAAAARALNIDPKKFAAHLAERAEA